MSFWLLDHYSKLAEMWDCCQAVCGKRLGKQGILFGFVSWYIWKEGMSELLLESTEVQSIQPVWTPQNWVTGQKEETQPSWTPASYLQARFPWFCTVSSLEEISRIRKILKEVLEERKAFQSTDVFRGIKFGILKMTKNKSKTFWLNKTCKQCNSVD